MADSADEQLRSEPADKETAIRALIARIEANEEEAVDIRVAQDALGLDAKAIKTIRKAKADAAAAQKTLDALMAGGLITPADTAALAAPSRTRRVKP